MTENNVSFHTQGIARKIHTAARTLGTDYEQTAGLLNYLIGKKQKGGKSR